MVNIVNLFKSRYRRSDRFERVIRPQIDSMYRFAYRLCGSRADAEDLVQDFLVRLFPKIDQLESVDKLSPWLSRGLYRLYVDSYRSSQRAARVFDTGDVRDEMPDERPSPFEHAHESEISADIAAALRQLNDDQRIVVLLHDAEGYTLRELSEILDTPVGTLKSRLHRARDNLKNLLATEPFVDLDRVRGTER